ncbi:DedA family protein [Dietzia alimentaria]|uniref:DedA family protein n=1 Tax=Dietzia alimentaria TaxID=665550 RepID=UPI00029AA0BB|nr:VTT domain-containing protein [Dietzia alimentaria]
MDRIAQQPFGIAFAALFVIVMLRANATYWLGRGAFGGGHLSRRFSHRLEGPTVQRAQRLAARYGVVAVPLSFLTVGVQTAVNFSAGFAGMPLRRYLLAVTVGSALWALLYSTVGLVGWAAIATVCERIAA